MTLAELFEARLDDWDTATFRGRDRFAYKGGEPMNFQLQLSAQTAHRVAPGLHAAWQMH